MSAKMSAEQRATQAESDKMNAEQHLFWQTQPALLAAQHSSWQTQPVIRLALVLCSQGQCLCNQADCFVFSSVQEGIMGLLGPGQILSKL